MTEGMKSKRIRGFSKMSKKDKLIWISQFLPDSQEAVNEMEGFWHRDPNVQQLLDEFSENTLTNFVMPYGIAPNFLIDGQEYNIPMVIEESSVIAAASNSAKFWSEHGGFHTEVISTVKSGNVHFIWDGPSEKLEGIMPELSGLILEATQSITANMVKRGGGILAIKLLNHTDKLKNYYKIRVEFETVDSMGANFINSCLEEIASILKEFIPQYPGFEGKEKEVKIIMSILSNYTPDCLVKTWVECDIDELAVLDREHGADEFAWKFEQAVRIAQVDPYRATTHNKGIFNGIDAVALATGNDFRAIEACGHTYASRNGHYTSLTDIKIEGRRFTYTLTVPLAMGTVGGLTSLHPLAKRSLEILGNPGGKDLMRIAAVTGLANNFGAVKSLVTKGIQVGHMKMHLMNILNQFQATEAEKETAIVHFTNHKVSYSAVEQLIKSLRS
ncbi:MAG: hydroxymethylglutaryl-CoA reductase, degradative [Bacteroidales bacterium]|nr:hydroxymethylglutaryl-CoA reductase, degradative [Bacteroidales bacterium]